MVLKPLTPITDSDYVIFIIFDSLQSVWYHSVLFQNVRLIKNLEKISFLGSELSERNYLVPEKI